MKTTALIALANLLFFGPIIFGGALRERLRTWRDACAPHLRLPRVRRKPKRERVIEQKPERLPPDWMISCCVVALMFLIASGVVLFYAAPTLFGLYLAGVI
jgi:hypothetical protein